MNPEFDDFREFIIWLCGYTDATEAPDVESWKKLQEKVYEVAAQFALYKRDRDHMFQPFQGYSDSTTTLSSVTTTLSSVK